MQLKSLDDLKPAPYNPRTISPDSLEALKVSIGEFGDISGITWNSRTGHLVTGHQRLKALREKYGDALKLEDGAVVTPDGQRFPVRVVDWSEAKEKAANVAANSPLLAGEFTPNLKDVLADIEVELPDLSESLRLPEIDLGGCLHAEVIDPPALPIGERPPFQQMTFTLHDAQVRIVKAALDKAKRAGPFMNTENTNSNGNALARIAEAYLSGPGEGHRS